MADIVISLTWGQVSLLVAGTGIVLGATGRWLIARTTKGLDAFVSEKAKNLATHQDIQKLVDQVRETEQVKQDISDSIWDRQMRWGLKKDTYIRLMELFAQLGVSYDIYKQAQRLCLKYPNDPKHQSTLDESLNKLLSLREELSRVMYSAPLVISAEADTILDGTQKLEELDHTDPDFQRKCETNMDLANDIASALMPVARKDLGYRR